jgi:CubicO group peptidase (beta-lactamase class C family)
MESSRPGGDTNASQKTVTLKRDIAKLFADAWLFYALGWVIQQTPNGNIIWHDGGTSSFGAYVGMVPDKNLGVIVLTNETNVGFPDAIGLWSLDRILDNPEVDHVAEALKAVTSRFDTMTKLFAKPANPRPFPPSHRSPASSSIRALARWRLRRKAMR